MPELTKITFVMAADIPAPSVVDHRSRTVYVRVGTPQASIDWLLRQSIQALRRGRLDEYDIG